MSYHTSQAIVDKIASLLSPTEPQNAPKLTRLLAEEGIKITSRSVRYALQTLILAKRARRTGRAGQRCWVFSVPEPAGQQAVDNQIRV